MRHVNHYERFKEDSDEKNTKQFKGFHQNYTKKIRQVSRSLPPVAPNDNEERRVVSLPGLEPGSQA